MKKRLIFLVVCSVIFAGADGFAQKKVETLEPNSVLYALPRTTLKVGVVVEREMIRKGPYARYAQRYLGVVAPLADKDIYRIKDATINSFAEADPMAIYSIDASSKSISMLSQSTEGVLMPINSNGLAERFATNIGTGIYYLDNPSSGVFTVSHIASDTAMTRVAIDRMSLDEKSLEAMAGDAASKIYTLRKRRLELISGEAGENVFGAGLGSAIAEIARLEDEYLSLFLGKHSFIQIVKEYEVTPATDKNTYIVCRFSTSEGLLPDSNLSGRPIIMELKAEVGADNFSASRKPSKSPMIMQRVAQSSNCTIIDGKDIIATERVLVYQFGALFEIPMLESKKM